MSRSGEGPGDSDGDAIATRWRAADEQAAHAGHRDRGDEQRGGHERPVGPLHAAGR